jgi:hypothetical protein
MERYEREPEPPVKSFADIARSLDDGETLWLSRNKVTFVADGLVYDQYPVHYEDLNYLSEIYQPALLGNDVTEQFREASNLYLYEKSLEARVAKRPEAQNYPLLTVVNHRTGQKVTEPVAIAQLIHDRRMLLHSIPRRTRGGGKEIIADMNLLVKQLAAQVGVGPIGTLCIDQNGFAMHPIDTELQTRVHFSPMVMSSAGELHGVPFYDTAAIENDWWGQDALTLIQYEIAQTFAANPFRTEGKGGSARKNEVTLHVASQTDMQVTMLSLIDTVEAYGGRLCYRRDMLETGIEGSFLTVVNELGQEVELLSAELDLDTSIYNAHLKAKHL